MAGKFLAQEDLLFLLAKGQRAECVAHTPLAHHFPGKFRGASISLPAPVVMWLRNISSSARPPISTVS